MSASRTPRHALVLVGHGSHLSPDSSAPIYAHAERIRRLGVFDEVVEAFWKEEPCLGDVLDLVESPNVWIVPIFLAEGYFTRQILPRELGLDGALTTRGDRRIHYLAPVGTHPAMAEMILRRARATAGLPEAARRRAALVVIGHGTERSPSSGDTVYALVEQLRAEREFGVVDSGFLDETPKIEDVLAELDSRDVVLVPFFVAEGWHTRTTIPQDLGLTGELTTHDDRRIWYTPPVGTLEEIADVVLAIAADAGVPVGRRAETDDAGAEARPDTPLALARSAFLQWLGAEGDSGREFLQLRISPLGGGRFEVRNRADLDRDRAELEIHRHPDAALAIARFTEGGVYRPLRTASDLPAGWVLADLAEQDLFRALSFLYPAAILHWHRGRTAPPMPLPYTRWATRQTGIYSGLRNLPEADLPDAIAGCCTARACLRTRLWDYSSPVSSAELDEAAVPCLEPCTLFATLAREIADKG